jgi:beta-lactam-binding protein with PASTA domain
MHSDRIFTARDTFNQIFNTLEVDLAVRDSDGFIFRIGYNLTLVGTIVEVGVRVPVPNILGEEEDVARRDLPAAGLQVGMVRHLPPPPQSFPPEVVVRQTPVAGTEVPIGTRVNFDMQQQRERPPRP